MANKVLSCIVDLKLAILHNLSCGVLKEFRNLLSLISFSVRPRVCVIFYSVLSTSKSSLIF